MLPKTHRMRDFIFFEYTYVSSYFISKFWFNLSTIFWVHTEVIQEGKKTDNKAWSDASLLSEWMNQTRKSWSWRSRVKTKAWFHRHLYSIQHHIWNWTNMKPTEEQRGNKVTITRKKTSTEIRNISLNNGPVACVQIIFSVFGVSY